MTDTKHTPEPWHVDLAASDVLSGVDLVARCYLHGNPDQRGIKVATTEANARRIVACVNYCAGLELHELEGNNLLTDSEQELTELHSFASRQVARLAALEKVEEAARIAVESLESHCLAYEDEAREKSGYDVRSPGRDSAAILRAALADLNLQDHKS